MVTVVTTSNDTVADYDDDEVEDDEPPPLVPLEDFLEQPPPAAGALPGHDGAATYSDSFDSYVSEELPHKEEVVEEEEKEEVVEEEEEPEIVYDTFVIQDYWMKMAARSYQPGTENTLAIRLEPPCRDDVGREDALLLVTIKKTEAKLGAEDGLLQLYVYYV